MARCGDGFIQGDEACDDGNSDDTDSCRNNCQLAACGDDVVAVGREACDDGNDVNDDECSNNCARPSCGDGVIQAVNGEECDDGNLDSTDGCLTSCLQARCGDGVRRTDLEAGQAGFEACDDGNVSDTDACTTNCEVARVVMALCNGVSKHATTATTSTMMAAAMPASCRAVVTALFRLVKRVTMATRTTPMPAELMSSR